MNLPHDLKDFRAPRRPYSFLARCILAVWAGAIFGAALRALT